jgi:hypothetical protein
LECGKDHDSAKIAASFTLSHRDSFSPARPAKARTTRALEKGNVLLVGTGELKSGSEKAEKEEHLVNNQWMTIVR